MKNTIYFLAIFVLLSVCTGGKQAYGNSESQAVDSITVNIKDIFLLLPENVFPKVPITLAQRKELLECIGEEGASEIYTYPVEVCDVKNGYLRLGGMQFDWEVNYWNLKDKRKMVIVHQGSEIGSTINYFFYENGKLTQDDNYRLDKDLGSTLADFIDVSQLSSDALNFAEKQFEKFFVFAEMSSETEVEEAFAIAFAKAVATPVNIKDIFMLLPGYVFNMDYSLANRKLLLNCIGEEKAYDISPIPIEVCDVKNGYLNLGGGWELCYWNMKDGRKLVATNSVDEDGSEINTFFYQNRILTEDPSYQLGGDQNYKLTDFVDVSKLSSSTRKLAEEQFAKGEYHIYFQLPQSGTSLKVRIDESQLMGYGEGSKIPEEAMKELTLKWVNEKWVR